MNIIILIIILIIIIGVIYYFLEQYEAPKQNEALKQQNEAPKQNEALKQNETLKQDIPSEFENVYNNPWGWSDWSECDVNCKQTKEPVCFGIQTDCDSIKRPDPVTKSCKGGKCSKPLPANAKKGNIIWGDCNSKGLQSGTPECIGGESGGITTCRNLTRYCKGGNIGWSRWNQKGTSCNAWQNGTRTYTRECLADDGICDGNSTLPGKTYGCGNCMNDINTSIGRREWSKKGVGLPQKYIHKDNKKEPIIYTNHSSLEALEVGWYYNWNLCERFETDVNYIPMIYSSRIDDRLKNAKTILLTNEPDHTSQGRMTVEDMFIAKNNQTEAMKAKRWKMLKNSPWGATELSTYNPNKSIWQQIKDLNVQNIGSVSPAGMRSWAYDLDDYINLRAWLYGDSRAAKDKQAELRGRKFIGWMPIFLTNAPEVAFVCVHWYLGKNPLDLIKFLKFIYNRYRKPIIITEYSPDSTGHAAHVTNKYNPDHSKNRFTQEEIDNFINVTTTFFETTEWIHGYAWHHSYYGNTRLWDSEGNLTATGITYRDADAKWRSDPEHKKKLVSY